jgi:hypothetical protein
MTRRVCFVTCLAWPNISDSDLHVKRALEDRHVTVAGLPWNAPEQRFRRLRRGDLPLELGLSPRAGGLSRLARPLEAEGRSLLESSRISFAGISASGICWISSSVGWAWFLPSWSTSRPPFHLPLVLAERGWRAAVVKPAIAASGHQATLVTAESVRDVAAAIDQGHLRRPAMVQPFLEDIRTRGECR